MHVFVMCLLLSRYFRCWVLRCRLRAHHGFYNVSVCVLVVASALVLINTVYAGMVVLLGGPFR